MNIIKNSRVMDFFYNKDNKFLHCAIIAFLLLFSYTIVYIAGGSKTAYVDLFIIVIIYSGVIFDIKGALIVSVISSFIIGPLMPLDTINSIAQESFDYILRSIFYIVTGLTIGTFSFLSKKNNLKIEYMLEHHHLTKLPTINESFDDCYKDYTTTDKYEMLFLRVNNYGKIIQSFSLEIWAEIIHAVYSKAQENSKEKYDLYQINSNEFLFVVQRDSSKMHVKEMHETYKSLLKENNKSMFLDVFYGVVPFNDSIVSMIQKGLSTLDYAVNNNVKIAHYQKGKRNKKEDLEIISSFREELRNDRLFVVFQPIVNIDTNRVANIEVLTRWNHSTLGMIPPSRFIKLVEETTLINDLSYWIIKECIRLLPAIIAENEDIVCSINISSRNLYDPDFVDILYTLLKDSGIPMKNINLELTERSILKLSEQSKQFFKEVKLMGASLSIDDFGTGFSTFSYITELDVNNIKIDKSFIKSINTDKKAYVIVKNMKSLAEALNIKVVAEGAETLEAVLVLKELGIHFVQGYYYAQPLEYEEIKKFIQKFNQSNT